MGQRQHGAGVMDRSADEPAVAGDVRGSEESEELADQRSQPVGQGLQRGDALRRRLELVGEVEPGLDERSAVVEHDGGGLGVGPDVELGHRCAVADGGAAAHERDAREAIGQIGGAPQRHGDVGQRPGRDQPDAFAGSDRLDDEAHRVPAALGSGGLGQVGAVKAAVTVDIAGVLRRGEQGPGRAPMHRCVVAEQVEDHESVAGGGLDRRVAGHRGDADQLGVAGGQDEGDGVVVARVAVDDDRHRHPPSLPRRREGAARGVSGERGEARSGFALRVMARHRIGG